MRAGIRYDYTGVIRVRICWACGEEVPPLYVRSPFQRNHNTQHTLRWVGWAS